MRKIIILCVIVAVLLGLLCLIFRNHISSVADGASILGIGITLFTALSVWFIDNKIVELKNIHWFELNLEKRISILQRHLRFLFDNVPVNSSNEHNVREVSNRCLRICKTIKEKKFTRSVKKRDLIEELDRLLEQTIKCCQNIQNTSKGESMLANDHIEKLTSSLAQLIDTLHDYHVYLKEVKK